MGDKCKYNTEVNKDYLKATKMQIFSQTLSPAFAEMTFSHIFELCFTKFKSILFAIECDDDIIINPKPDYLIRGNTKAFFIAEDKDLVKWSAIIIDIEDKVKRRYVQESGFDTIDNAEEINLLNISSVGIEKTHGIGDNLKTCSPNRAKTKDKTRSKKDKKKGTKSRSSSTSSTSSTSSCDGLRQTDERRSPIRCDYDSTALFHWCADRPIEKCILQKY
ncbi:unnamed protein product, partial [Medioppia subpectinata]